jgi:hypothetical protein
MGHFKSKKAVPSFNKPSTNLNTEHNKEWRSALPNELSEGDILAGSGVIKAIFESCDGTWYIEAGDSTEDFFSNNVALYAFTRKVN